MIFELIAVFIEIQNILMLLIIFIKKLNCIFVDVLR